MELLYFILVVMASLGTFGVIRLTARNPLLAYVGLAFWPVLYVATIQCR